MIPSIPFSFHGRLKNKPSNFHCSSRYIRISSSSKMCACTTKIEMNNYQISNNILSPSFCIYCVYLIIGMREYKRWNDRKGHNYPIGPPAKQEVSTHIYHGEYKACRPARDRRAKGKQEPLQMPQLSFRKKIPYLLRVLFFWTQNHHAVVIKWEWIYSMLDV